MFRLVTLSNKTYACEVESIAEDAENAQVFLDEGEKVFYVPDLLDWPEHFGEYELIED